MFLHHRPLEHPSRIPLLVGVILACSIGEARATLPLTINDTRGVDGKVSVETSDWKLVFDEDFNGGPSQWFDLAWPGGSSDSAEFFRSAARIGSSVITSPVSRTSAATRCAISISDCSRRRR